LRAMIAKASRSGGDTTRYFLPGRRLLSFSIIPCFGGGAAGVAVGVAAEGLGWGAACAADDEPDGCVAGGALAFWSFGLSCCRASAFGVPGSGVEPFTTLSAKMMGTFSVSFLTRMEMRRLEGSVGLSLMRSIWSA